MSVGRSDDSGINERPVASILAVASITPCLTRRSSRTRWTRLTTRSSRSHRSWFSTLWNCDSERTSLAIGEFDNEAVRGRLTDVADANARLARFALATFLGFLDQTQQLQIVECHGAGKMGLASGRTPLAARNLVGGPYGAV